MCQLAGKDGYTCLSLTRRAEERFWFKGPFMTGWWDLNGFEAKLWGNDIGKTTLISSMAGYMGQEHAPRAPHAPHLH